MSAELKRSDIIEDAAFKVPREYAKEWQVPIDQLDVFITKMKTLGTTIQSSNSIPKLKEDTVQLTQAQVELDKIQKQIQVTTAKNNDTYIEQQKALAALKQEMKDKILLGDRDAKTVTAQNASQQVLGAALNKNRQSYAALKDEQSRNTKEGKDLLETINKQDKSFKELSDSVGKHQEHVGAYAEQLAFLSPQLGDVTEKVTGLGQKLLTIATSGAGAIIAALAAAFILVKESISSYFETTAAGEETLDRFKGQIEGVRGSVNKLLSDLGKKIVGDSITDRIKGLVANIPGLSILANLFEAAGEKGEKVTEKQIALQEELIRRTIEMATAENKATKDIFESRDKINHSDVERLALLKEANAIREDELKKQQDIAKKELQILVDKIHLSTNDPTLAQKQAVADAEAKIINLETESLRERRRGHDQEIALNLEIEKSDRDKVIRIKNSNIDLRKSELELVVKTNKDIIANDDSTLEKRQSALTQETSAQFEILDRDRQQQLLNAENGAKERLIARNNEFATNKESLDKALAEDVAFGKEKLKIENDYLTKSEGIAAEYSTTFRTNLAKGYTDATLTAKRSADQQLDDLNVLFNAGGISYKEYESKRARISKQGNIDAIHDQIEFQKLSIDTLTAFGQDTTKAEKSLHDLEVLEAKAVAERKLDIEKKLHEAKIRLANEFVNSTVQIGNNLYDAELSNIDARSKALKDHYDEDVSQAGDNANLKAKLQAKYDADQKKLDQQRITQERRKAEFDKKLAETKVIINTAENISNYTGELPESFPLIAIAAAEGALQLAVIQSQPLPQYEKGTDYAIGGPSVVGEKGTEMFVSPSGNLGFTPSVPTIMNLERGTKVFTHDETMSAVATANMGGSTMDDKDEYLNERFLNKLDRVESAIKNNKPSKTTSFVQNGLQLIKVVRSRDNFTKLTGDVNMGKWTK